MDALNEHLAAGRNAILVHGARVHNLKDLSVVIPRGQLVVVTGVSGSGKSTLAFDLVFAEGQRRFLDCMSAYARQFAEQIARPDVDLIAGLPPTVSIEQRTSSGGGKSTVATVTEVHHFLRLLFARLGTQFCPDCDVPVQAQTRDEVGGQIEQERLRRGDLLLLSPVLRNRKGFHSEIAEWAARQGYAELRADGRMYRTDEPFRLDRFKEHDIEVVIGVLEGPRGRRKGGVGKGVGGDGPSPQQLVDEALRIGKGTVFALDNRGTITVHSTERACVSCGRSFEPLDPKQFSYNSSQGWCPSCRGFGEMFDIPDVDRGARADAIEESWWTWQEGKREVCPECNGARLNRVSRSVRLTGTVTGQGGAGDGEGCSTGAGPAAGPTIDGLGAWSVEMASTWFDAIEFSDRGSQIARDILPEIRSRLAVLRQIGLGYLQLSRSVTTLSGGEGQRIRLAAQLGSNLSGVLYVLDEPTIGLHARDNDRLLDAMEQLKRRGNSLLVVEHDEETMRRADHIIDLGPGAGVLGGRLVAEGTLRELMDHPASVTGASLRGVRSHPARGQRRPVGKPPEFGVGGSGEGSVLGRAGALGQTEAGWLLLEGASMHNLRGVSVALPLGRFVVVSGVSGSGKSTLIRECLLPSLEAVVKRPSGSRGQSLVRAGEASDRSRGVLRGGHLVQAVYEVDQSPIGRTPRSTPATYVGFFDEIRALFAQLPESRMRGYTGSRFSFNSAAGRCPQCEGAGQIKLEMNFLPPAFVRCEACQGTRFNRETLDVEYAGKTIAEVLELSVDEAIGFFQALPRIHRPLEALRDTGLGYLRLGQTSPTLSGGEAQRVKLVTHLLSGLKGEGEGAGGVRAPVASGKRSLFLLEEPTIGLHVADVRRLVEVIQRLVDHGHTVVVIEHNLELIAEADWVLDLGPEAGEAGGRVVVQGTPEAVAGCGASHTGRFLQPMLGGGTEPLVPSTTPPLSPTAPRKRVRTRRS